MQSKRKPRPNIVIIGGGFAGINVARQLRTAAVDVTLIDKHNYHTFQPLLYQVAIGAIEGDSVGFPIRRVFTRQKNFRFLMSEVLQIREDKKEIDTTRGLISYDYLIIATGSDTNFFGNHSMQALAMPMKSIPEALNIRSVILQNLEAVSFTEDKEEKMALMTFVVVGGGPTGVELAGALAEMRRLILMKDYHDLKSAEMSVYLIEGKTELLAAMSDQASATSQEYLEEDGVKIFKGVHVKTYDGYTLTIDDGMAINTKNVFWTAGVKGMPPAGISAEVLNKAGRIQTDEFNRVLHSTNVFAIGDVAAVTTVDLPGGHPGVAPVAIQQGKHLAGNIKRLLAGEDLRPFRYSDKGALATVGRNKAIADFGKLHFRGIFAWLLWGVIHLMSIAGFTNKGVIFLNWLINYLNKNSDNRLIIHPFNAKKSAIKA